MFSCKELINLSVLSLYEGELIGIVDKLCFDKTLKKLSFLGLVGEDGTRWLIPTKSIYHIGPNAVTIKNKQNIILEIGSNTDLVIPIGCKAYSIEGEYHGTISDISFNNKYMTNKIYLDNGKMENVEDVTSSGKTTVIFSTNKIKQRSFAYKEETKEQDVKIMPVDVNVVPAQKSKHIDPSEFLLGRRCLKDIVNFNNEILIKANTLITKKHISNVKKYGKLKELMLFSD